MKLLCSVKANQSPAGIVPCSGVALPSVLSLVLSLSLLEVRPFLVSRRGFGVCADFVGVSKTLLTKLGKEERFFPGFSGNSPQIRGIFQHYNDVG